MSIRTLLVSASLLAIVCGNAQSQPPITTRGGAPKPVVIPVPPLFDVPPSATPLSGGPPALQSVDDLLVELESLRAQKAALEKKEQEVTAALRKKLDAQAERLKKLAIAPKEGKAVTPAVYPLTFDQDGPKKDKKEVVVALLTQVAPGSGPQFATTADELADKLAKALPKLAEENENKRKVKVLSPAQVDKFKAANPAWKKMSANEIGEKLGADFVLEVCLDKLRLYQPGSLNNIYEGRAEVQINIHDIGTQDRSDKYNAVIRVPEE